ncbi:MAG TPA: Bax inhibitor-1/YccA family protein [Candidatus Aphodocola excrementigallinarum]|uniref:Bax inhibitor-1/YccA family protein n=1 Tax=Candidatus Aphodocola excrementigallinarum TaxID=2840670 RepID=A0A9D1IN64_9FIRM|nr:Bax inhibitor-1/YccA family protein [Candidatus Aphodocola excrementigallinarum]
MVIDSGNGMSKFFTKVYLWMFVGLLISFGVAYYTSTNLNMIYFMLRNYTWIILAELLVVIFFSFLRRKVSSLVAGILFVVYAALSGLTLSSIFIVYEIGSIGMVFLSAALMFGLLAVYGYVTKNDLSSMGKILIFALLAIIIMSLINLFVYNSTFGVIISVISIVVFLGLTAWDMQNLKMIYNYYASDDKELNKASIYGALDLYLDFINIFLQLLSLFGKRKD